MLRNGLQRAGRLGVDVLLFQDQGGAVRGFRRALVADRPQPHAVFRVITVDIDAVFDTPTEVDADRGTLVLHRRIDRQIGLGNLGTDGRQKHKALAILHAPHRRRGVQHRASPLQTTNSKRISRRSPGQATPRTSSTGVARRAALAT